jgi:lysylphosphatidylglycerol synthetase-like protein (DUF2156 family)
MFIPAKDLWLLAAGGGASYGARYMALRIEAALSARRRRFLPDPTGELLRLQTLYGYNPHSLVSIAPGALVWSTPEIDGAIIYGEFGRVWLAAGDPLTAPENRWELAHRFVARAKRKNRVVAFVPSTSDFAHLAAAEDFTAVKVGASPYFDLQHWEPRGDSAKKLRSGINQARRGGVEVEAISGSVKQSLKHEATQLSMRWLASHPSGMVFGWLVALDPFLHSDHKRYFTARVNGELIGFLAASPIPARRGWYLEDVLHDDEAPPGTSTLLVVEALRCLREQGAALATLGTAPLATDGLNDLPVESRVVERTLEMASRKLGHFYNFEGLRRFKGKFVPSHWESEYALLPRGVAIPPRVAHAIIRALVPGGLSRILTRQALRMLRESAPAVKSRLTRLENVTRSRSESSKLSSSK